MPPPRLQDVLARVRRGRVAYICLTREQKRALGVASQVPSKRGVRIEKGPGTVKPQRCAEATLPYWSSAPPGPIEQSLRGRISLQASAPFRT